MSTNARQIDPAAMLPADLPGTMQDWRRRIHAYPETAYEEHRTAELVSDSLQEFGVEVHTGIAETGVVGVLRSGTGRRSIGLRADLDALPLKELNEFGHRSRRDGKMHACGHDGHTAMLLGAAKHLASTARFDGTVYFIFQPAEESEGGARRMLDEGMLQRFPMDSVYGLHNLPGLPVGRFRIVSGPALSSYDTFEICISGKGGHAGMPQATIDPIVAGSQLVTALQTIVSRSLDPLEASAISVTSVRAGETWNVIPDTAVLRGSVRTFNEDVRNTIEAKLTSVSEGICASFGATAAVDYERRYPPTVNHEGRTAEVRRIVSDTFGAPAIDDSRRPLMASEDFAYFLGQVPGCFVLMGNGDDDRKLHSPHYDFNDTALSWGAAYWTRLVERLLRA